MAHSAIAMQNEWRREGWRVPAHLAVLACICLSAKTSAAQSRDLPFAIGERLTYHVSTSKLHASGRASMWIDGPLDARGTNLVVLHSDIRIGVGPVKAMSTAESWLDPHRMAALYFHKTERRPLASAEVSVELFPEDRRWQDAKGRTGESPTDAPLDELSFLYYIRTLPLTSDSAYSVFRHFSAERNPVSIRVLGREIVTTKAGSFNTIVVEMTVKDAARYDGSGVIRLNLTDDRLHLPVRMESVLPMVGLAVFNLEAYTAPAVLTASTPHP
jgi:hypothetical protein